MEEMFALLWTSLLAPALLTAFRWWLSRKNK